LDRSTASIDGFTKSTTLLLLSFNLVFLVSCQHFEGLPFDCRQNSATVKGELFKAKGLATIQPSPEEFWFRKVNAFIDSKLSLGFNATTFPRILTFYSRGKLKEWTFGAKCAQFSTANLSLLILEVRISAPFLNILIGSSFF
jgi:hypothetical protein